MAEFMEGTFDFMNLGDAGAESVAFNDPPRATQDLTLNLGNYKSGNRQITYSMQLPMPVATTAMVHENASTSSAAGQVYASTSSSSSASLVGRSESNLVAAAASSLVGKSASSLVGKSAASLVGGMKVKARRLRKTAAASVRKQVKLHYDNREILENTHYERRELIETIRSGQQFRKNIVQVEDPRAPIYENTADPDVYLNLELATFKQRVKENLDTLQPVPILERTPERRLEDLIEIIITFASGIPEKHFGEILQKIGHRPLCNEDLTNKTLVGNVLLKYIKKYEVASYNSLALLPTFVNSLFVDEVKLNAVAMTYFLLKESLDIRNSAALLRLVAHLAQVPPAFMISIDNGFKFTHAAIDQVKRV